MVLPKTKQEWNEFLTMLREERTKLEDAMQPLVENINLINSVEDEIVKELQKLE